VRENLDYLRMQRGNLHHDRLIFAELLSGFFGCSQSRGMGYDAIEGKGESQPLADGSVSKDGGEIDRSHSLP